MEKEKIEEVKSLGLIKTYPPEDYVYLSLKEKEGSRGCCFSPKTIKNSVDQKRMGNHSYRKFSSDL